MWCNQCGREIEEWANFCKYCGNCIQESLNDYIERAKKNDQQALAEIYRYSVPAVYKVVQVLIKDHDTVNDIIQDTYVKAFTRMDQLQNPGSLIPWLKMIATNTAKDWLKKSKPIFFSELEKDGSSDEQSFMENIEDENVDQNPEMVADQKEVSRLVMEILEQLPEDQRMVVGMFYYEEMSVKDIAASLGLSENTVKSRLSYARKKIKEQVLELEKQGTRLYSVAPFTFFLYLLHAMQKAPADPSDIMVMQQIWKWIDGNIGVPAEAAEQAAAKAAAKSATKSATKTVAKSAVKTATGTAARQISVKMVALLMAGGVGAGGIAYGIAKHADMLPFTGQTVKQEETETERMTRKETEKETRSGQQSETQTEMHTEVQSEYLTEEAETKGMAFANGVTDEQSLYQAFYETYVTNENLQVVENEWQNDNYDRDTQYTQDMLLAAYMDDFGGDGKEELLLVRTRREENEYDQSVMSQKIYIELYGIDGQEVTLRQTLKYDSSDLNERTPYNIEEIGKQKIDNDYYLCRYAMYHASAGGGVYDNTIVKITDQELIQVWDLYYTSFTGGYGSSVINGEDCYTGNVDADIGYLDSILQPYGLEAYKEMQGVPCIMYMTRNEIWDEDDHIFWRDAFLVSNCFRKDANASDFFAQDGLVSESNGFTGNVNQGEELYYMTILDHQEGGQSGEYWMPGTTGVSYDSDSITFQASFSVGKEGTAYGSKEGFYPYGTYTFALTPETQYYFQTDEERNPTSQAYALSICESLNGLVVELKVKDGKVETLTFKS